jgi:alpha-L-glutamate ligase-like protein
MNPLSILRILRARGVLGINNRNVHFTLGWNPRRLYPLVDDKLQTKRLCQEAGITVPALFGVAQAHFEIPRLLAAIGDRDSFVLKPAHGAMGNGILVIVGRDGKYFLRTGGRRLTAEDISYHAASTISGLYALGGRPDFAMIEERLIVHPELVEVCPEGAPDVRVVVHRGIPVMVMTRLPTQESGGRANLHQGAIGAGIDLSTGRVVHAVQRGRSTARHPDSRKALRGLAVPHFERIVEIAVRATDLTGLGYVGADVVVDAKLGPVILELNARPGLAIQLANRAGLLPRLRAVHEHWRPDLPVEERIALGRRIAQEAARIR